MFDHPLHIDLPNTLCLTAMSQANVTNCTVVNNTAFNGGALSVEGAGAFLTVNARSRIAGNIATPSDPSAAAGSSGGCIYGQQCQGLLLAGAQVLQCQAVAGAGGQVTVNGLTAESTGRSLGGGIMTDGCKAVVLDGASLSRNTAGAGGGIAARDTSMLLIINSAIIFNTASAANITSTTAGTLETLRGAGGGIWASGNTVSLLRNSQLANNAAELLAGGAAAFTQCTNNGTLAPPQVQCC